jgi:hypothetical protein
MATSGTHNFDPTFDDILQDAAGMVGGGPILAEELISARRGLDILLTKIQSRNLFLHKIETTTVPAIVSVETYPLDQSVLDVLHITSERTSGGSDITMTRLGYQQWAEIPTKDRPGQPLQYWFNRGRQSNTLHLWPLPDDTYNLTITLQKTAEDTIRAFDNVDVPRRFIPALVFGLAYWIGLRRSNRVPADRLALLRGEFNEAVREAMDEDRERASIRINLGW